MSAKRASLADRKPKTAPERGRGVEALFEPTPEPQSTPAPRARRRMSRRVPASKGPLKTSTFNLHAAHQNFLDDFVRRGKREFRERGVGVGAINKSAVLQEALELLRADEALQQKVIEKLEEREKQEGSRHDPTKKNS